MLVLFKSRMFISIMAISTLGLAASIAQQQVRNWNINQITKAYQAENSTLRYGSNRTSISVDGNIRTITTNSVAPHAIGAGNRNSPSAINSTYRIDAAPRKSNQITYTKTGTPFGVSVSGILFDAFAAEWYAGDRNGWNYSVPGGAIPLGIDSNGGHVQPSGMYHYHNLPTALMASLGWREDRHSPLIGYAADGFPIYALTGVNGQMHRSSYVLKNGSRPGGGKNPGGTYDGTFHNDWQYVSGAGSLDECNGVNTINNDYPAGTYAYFLTNTYPVIPACLKGSYSKDFQKSGGSGGNASQSTQRPTRRGDKPRPPRRK